MCVKVRVVFIVALCGAYCNLVILAAKPSWVFAEGGGIIWCSSVRLNTAVFECRSERRSGRRVLIM